MKPQSYGFKPRKISELTAMFTSSIVLWMIINTVAASAAPFVALLVSALETGHRVAPVASAKVAAGLADGALAHQEVGLADAA